jgi:hypothetical protein
MIHSNSFKRGESMAEMYTVEEEITEKQSDGRIFLVAAKGARIPMSRALQLGLVKGKQKAEPSETKEAAPTETKAPAKRSAKKSAK